MAEQTPNPDAESQPDPAQTAGPAGEEQAQETPLTPDQLAEQAMLSAEEAGQKIAEDAGPMELPDFAPPENGEDASAGALSLLNDVQLHVKIELGRTQMYVEDVLSLNENSIVELDKAAGDPVDIYVNDRHVARGEVLVLNDSFCVRVSEIVRPVGVEKPDG